MSEMQQQAVPCAVVQDLLPLYAENLTGEETGQLIREHTAHCPACAQSLGAQQAMLTMQKSEMKKDRAGQTFLKKVKMKRLLLIALTVALAYCAAYWVNGVFTVGRPTPDRDIELQGRYQLSDGRIALAVTAKGVYPSTLGPVFTHANWVTDTANERRISVNIGHFSATDWNRWFGRPDERGETFYYVFDPAQPVSILGYDLAFVMRVADEEYACISEVRAGKNMTLWKAGDEVRALTAEEEAALLQAVDTYQDKDTDQDQPELNQKTLKERQDDFLNMLMEQNP